MLQDTEPLLLSRLRLGDFRAVLPIVQHSLLSFSRHVSEDLVSHGYEASSTGLGKLIKFMSCRDHQMRLLFKKMHINLLKQEALSEMQGLCNRAVERQI